MLAYDKYDELVSSAPNFIIQDCFINAYRHIDSHDKIMVSISGGSDSDVMLDILSKFDVDKKITYVWFNTGLEYEATKKHLTFLENKYGIKIQELKAKKPIPLTCRKYGQPFLSKQVSEYIARLQKHNFKWEDKPFEELYKEYPKCKVALRWWCNDWGEGSRFNISYNTYLKEFMVENPPTFPISNICCTYAKKGVAKDFLKENEFDLNCVGVRKAEGGSRASAYKSCYTPSSDCGRDDYRPIFWFKEEDKSLYEETFGVTHSDCYSVWGLTRTGCAACPFGRNFETELECVKKYEPKFYKAVWKIFGDSYEYTRKYREFQRKMKNR